MSFTAPTKQPIVKPKEKTKYEFKSGGKKKMVIAEANKVTPIGNFIPGTYRIPAMKSTENGDFAGHLKFDFRQSNSETVDVTEDFEEANISVTLKGDTKLNDSSKKVTINDHEWHFQVPKRMVHIHKIKILPFQLQVKRKIKHLQHRRRRLKLAI